MGITSEKCSKTTTTKAGEGFSTGVRLEDVTSGGGIHGTAQNKGLSPRVLSVAVYYRVGHSWEDSLSL